MVYSADTGNEREVRSERMAVRRTVETIIMVSTRISMALLLLGLLSACGGPGENATVPKAQPAGATMVNIGNHVIHFSAQSTDQLPPEVARAYNIVRSKNRAMLNVSVLTASDNLAVNADVTVKTVNLTGQLKNVTMRRIVEQEAIYYIGEVAVANRETLIFDISVTPDGEDTSSEIRFKRQFYTD
ncbi:MAG: DUF4426 domain-containing protein [Proteobacteria bacterium]|nr:DUF4426 domain-containing protein [Pseudomonadota bacterium]